MGGGVLAVLVAASGAARATSLLESEDWTLDLDGSAKLYGLALHLSWPAVLPATLGWESNTALAALGELRLKFSGSWRDRVSWNVQLQSAAFLANQPNALTSMGGGVAALADPPRALPLQYTDLDDPKAVWRAQFDRLWVKVRIWKLDLRVGRQPVSLGVGFIWQPADLVGTFSFLELDREFKPGVDALRLDWSLGESTELTVVGVAGGPVCRHVSRPRPVDLAAPSVWRTPAGDTCNPADPRFTWDHSVGLLRFRTSLGPADLGLLGGWVRGDLVAGAFGAAVLGRWKLRSEVTFTHDFSADDTDGPYWSPVNDFVRAVAGVEYSFRTSRPLNLEVEFYYNGFGSLEAEGYLRRAALARVAEFGEVWNLGQVYLGSALRWQAADTVETSVLLVANLVDPSAHLSATVSFSLSDESSLVVGGFLPVGRGPEVRFGPAGPEVVARSEFGLYPYMLYSEYKRYF